MQNPAPALLAQGPRVAWNPDYSGPYEGEFYAADDVKKLIDSREALLAACVEFVRKCDAGEARSVSSYAQMVAAIAMCKDA